MSSLFSALATHVLRSDNASSQEREAGTNSEQQASLFSARELRAIREMLLRDRTSQLFTTLDWVCLTSAGSGRNEWLKPGSVVRFKEYADRGTQVVVAGPDIELTAVVDIVKLRAKPAAEWDASNLALAAFAESESRQLKPQRAAPTDVGDDVEYAVVIHAWAVHVAPMLGAIADVMELQGIDRVFVPALCACIANAPANKAAQIRSRVTWQADRAMLYSACAVKLEVLACAVSVADIVEAAHANIPLQLVLAPGEQRVLLKALRDDYEVQVGRFALPRWSGLVAPSGSTAALDETQAALLEDCERADAGVSLRGALSEFLRLAVLQQRGLVSLIDNAQHAESSELAHLLNDYGGVLSLLAEYKQAETCFREALACLERTGASPRGRANVLQNLAATLSAQNRFACAAETLERGLELLGAATTFERAGLLNDLGGVRFEQGRLDEAMTCYELAGAAYEANTSPALGVVRHNMGNVLYARCRFADALKRYNEALALQMSRIAPPGPAPAQSAPIGAPAASQTHPNVLNTLQGIALVHLELGDHAKAKEMLRNNLAAEECAFGAQHPRALRARQMVAAVMVREGSYECAVSEIVVVMKGLVAALGSQHIEVAAAHNLLGSALGEMEQHTASLEQFEAALEIQYTQLGRGHPLVGSTLNNIGYVLRQLGHLDAAMVKLQEARVVLCAIKQQTTEQALVLFNIAAVHLAMGEIGMALIFVRQSLTLQWKLLGRKHPRLVQTLNLFGRIRIKQGEYHSAKDALMDALDIGLTFQGPGHPHVGETMAILGSLASARGEPASAARYLSRALAVFQATLPPDSPTTMQLLHDLVMCASSSSDEEDDEEDDDNDDDASDRVSCLSDGMEVEFEEVACESDGADDDLQLQHKQQAADARPRSISEVVLFV